VNFKKLNYFIISSAFALGTASAATVTTFTSESSWEAAVSSFVTEPFDGPLQSFTGVTTDVGAIGLTRGMLTGSVWNDGGPSGNENTTFSYVPGPFFGAGAFFDTSVNGEGNGVTVTLNLTGGGTQVITPDPAILGLDNAFFGFTSDVSIDSFTLTSNSETFDMDNLEFGGIRGAPTPEPATFSLIGIGIAGLAVLRKKLA